MNVMQATKGDLCHRLVIDTHEPMANNMQAHFGAR